MPVVREHVTTFSFGSDHSLLQHFGVFLETSDRHAPAWRQYCGQTRAAFSTCTATSGNGVMTGTTDILQRGRVTPSEEGNVILACIEAAAMTIIPGTTDPPAASASRRRRIIPTWASG